MLNRMKALLFKGQEQSQSIRWNILLSSLLKGINVIISLLLVPVVLKYLDSHYYGLWLTISSVLSWIVFFDIGLSGGLRVNLAEFFAKSKLELAKIYVSTTYFLVTVIIGIVLFIFVITNFFLNYQKIFNTDRVSNDELKIFIFMVVIFTAMKFILQILGVILIADQKPAIKELIDTISRILILVLILVLIQTKIKSLLMVGVIYTLVPVIVYLFSSFYFYNKKKGIYYNYRPALDSIKKKYFKSLTTLSSKFFIIKISFIILFTTDNIIITQLFGLQEVTTYNIALKYFSIILFFSSMIYLPFTSAYAHAYHKGDFKWIRKITNKIIFLSGILACVIISMILVSDFVYAKWLGNQIEIPRLLTIFTAISVLIQVIGTPFNAFLNGIGKIKVQLRISIFIAILNIPLSVILAKYLEFGVSGVILATCICNFIPVLAQPIQYYLIMGGKAKGIWN